MFIDVYLRTYYDVSKLLLFVVENVVERKKCLHLPRVRHI